MFEYARNKSNTYKEYEREVGAAFEKDCENSSVLATSEERLLVIEKLKELCDEL